MNVDVPGQPFNCPRCGAPGYVAYGGATYTCQCRFGNYGRLEFTPMPPSPDGAEPLRLLTEEEIRGIVRDELSRGGPP